jgi:hypothetical protein
MQRLSTPIISFNSSSQFFSLSIIYVYRLVDFSSFLTSVVIQNDMVSRLSLPKLCKLRHDVLEAISRAKVNKMLIMQALFRDFDSEVT